MPYTNALRRFNRENGYVVNEKRMVDYVSNIMRNHPENPDSVDKSIRERIVNDFFAFDGPRYERHRQEMIQRSRANPNNRRLREAVASMASPTGFVEGYFTLVSEIAKAVAAREKVDYKPLPYFGLKGSEVTKIAMTQVEGCNYAHARRYELFKANSITDPKFLAEAKALEDMVNTKKTYATVEPEERENIHKIYVSNKLVKDRLESKTWWWKLLHRGQTKAMQKYVETAGKLLSDLKVPAEGSSEASELDAFMKQGYAMIDPSQKNALMNRFAEVERTIDENLVAPAEERARKLDEVKQKRQKEKEIKKADAFRKRVEAAANKRAAYETAEALDEIKAANSKSIEDNLFEIRFRPSFDKEEFDKQIAARKGLKEPLIKSGTKQQRSVFFHNTRKLALMKQYFEKVGQVTDPEEIQTMQNEYTITIYGMDADAIVDSTKGLKNNEKFVPFSYTNSVAKEAEDNAALMSELALDFNTGDNLPKGEIVKESETLKKDLTIE